MDIFKIAEEGGAISDEELAGLLEEALRDWESRRGAVRNALIIPPDFTRYHSNAGFITCAYCRLLAARGAEVDVMPALGTHVPVSETQWKVMFPDVPYDKMIVHGWRTDVVTSSTSTGPIRPLSIPCPASVGISPRRWYRTGKNWAAIPTQNS